MSSNQFLEMDVVVPAALSEKRLDQVIAELLPDYSRSRLQQWIKQGGITVNGGNLRPKDKVHVNDLIEVNVEMERQGTWEAQNIDLDVVYQDDALIVLDKPAGMVVHPAAGNPDGTLVNALLYRFPELEKVPRAGIVHRLDKDTTGLLVVARNLATHNHIVTQLQARTMGREYEAIVIGEMTGGGTIDQPIARHPKNRKKMAVVPFGKPSVTHYRLLERFNGFSHLRVKLETGRTHQIRVHMAHIKHPLVGDPVYGGRLKLPPGLQENQKIALRDMPRQALHARQLSLNHPETGEVMTWESALPEDMQSLLEVLREAK